MKKAEYEALVNTLRVMLDEARQDRDLARAAEGAAIGEKQNAIYQLRALERQGVAPMAPPLRDWAEAVYLLNAGTRYLPAQENEVPDIWVIDAHTPDAPRVGFKQVGRS